MYELVNDYSSSALVYASAADPKICHKIAEELNLSSYCIRLRTYLDYKLYSEDITCYQVQTN